MARIARLVLMIMAAGLCWDGRASALAQTLTSSNCDAVLTHAGREEYYFLSEQDRTNWIYHRICRSSERIDSKEFSLGAFVEAVIPIEGIPVGGSESLDIGFVDDEQERQNYCETNKQFDKDITNVLDVSNRVVDKAIEAWIACKRLEKQDFLVEITDMDSEVIHVSVAFTNNRMEDFKLNEIDIDPQSAAKCEVKLGNSGLFENLKSTVLGDDCEDFGPTKILTKPLSIKITRLLNENNEGEAFYLGLFSDLDQNVLFRIPPYPLPSAEAVSSEKTCAIPRVDKQLIYTNEQYIDFDSDGCLDICYVVRYDEGLGANSSGQVTCALANGKSVSKPNIDTGYIEGRRWIDFDGKGNYAYCRLIGSNNATNSQLACVTSMSGDFTGSEYKSKAPIDWGYAHSRKWYDDDSDGILDYCRGVGPHTAIRVECVHSREGRWDTDSG